MPANQPANQQQLYAQLQQLLSRLGPAAQQHFGGQNNSAPDVGGYYGSNYGTTNTHPQGYTGPSWGEMERLGMVQSGLSDADKQAQLKQYNDTQKSLGDVQKQLQEATAPQGLKPASTPAMGGSLVDFLNSQGMPSDPASRAKLAAQFGIQNYQRTAGQNTQLLDALKQKYQSLHKGMSGEAPPTKGGAMPEINRAGEAYTAAQPPGYQPPPTTPNVDNFFGTNPGVSQSSQQLMELLSPQTQRDDLFSLQSKILGEQNTLSKQQLELMDMKRVMSGTDDDIRAEVTKAGGFATESQVQALTISRNQSLVKRAGMLQDQMAYQQSLVSNDTQLLQFEKGMANDQFSQRLNVLQYVQQNQQDTFKASLETAKWNVGQMGYQAYSSSLDPMGKMRAGILLMGDPSLFFDQARLNKMDTFAQQRIAQSAQKINISMDNSGILAALREAQTGYYGARARQSDASGINAVIKQIYPSTQANPLNNYASSAQWMNKLDEAYKASTDPNIQDKNVSDLALIDAAVKIDNGGQQITETQVNTLLRGASIPARVTVTAGKITGLGALLTDGQRKAIRDLSTNTFAGQKKLADQGIQRINSSLQRGGYDPSTFLRGIDDYTAMRDLDTISQGTTVGYWHGQQVMIPSSRTQEFIDAGYTLQP